MRSAKDMPRCIVCEGESVSSFCLKEKAYYLKCGTCGLIFQHPMPDPEEMLNYANELYRNGGYSDYIKAKEIKYAHFLSRLAQFREDFPKGRLLDIGCSCGYFLDVALKSGYDAYGVDFSEEAISAAGPEISKRIIRCNVNDLTADRLGQFDIITAFDIIEHAHNPVGFLRQARGMLKDGGGMIISTPDSGHFLRYILGCRWPMLQPMQHTVLFSRKAMHLCMRRAGFGAIRLASAHKVVTADYLFEQIRHLNPFIYKAYSLVKRLAVKAIIHKAIRINIGEMLAIGTNSDIQADIPEPKDI